MRRRITKATTAILSAVMVVSTTFSQGETSLTAHATETKDSDQTVTAADKTIRLNPAEASTFNDTDGDGLGEFQGWGTSLCWWANRVGYNQTLTQKTADAFFGQDGLRMNIGRYNIGGGDNVGTVPKVSVNEKAAFYGLSGDTAPTYSGSSMSVGTNSNFKSAKYSGSDADFGITSGDTVGEFSAIGWINSLNGTVGSGGNLHYKVNADADGTYTVKMLFTLSGTNDRGVSLQVSQPEQKVLGARRSRSEMAASSASSEASSDESSSAASASSQEENKDADSDENASKATTEASTEKTDQSGAGSDAGSDASVNDYSLYAGSDADTEKAVYTVDSAAVNKNVIAASGNRNIYVVTFKNVALKEGENDFDIGGAGEDWCLDYMKMAVIKSGEEGVLPETSPYLHASHITRSDSVVPGYCTDVTKIDLEAHDRDYYTGNFTRADFDCGYAWNYDWDADQNQVNVLKAAAKAAGDSFIAEAFSNSPPYFMTESGCSSGNTDAGKDNLRSDSYDAFACYMADVIEHWDKEGVVKFQSADPMNEPYTSYWGAYSNKQEGCHFDQGDSESKILVRLNQQLKNKGIDLIISAADETSIDTSISSYNKLSDDAKNAIGRIDTHSYSGSDRAGLQDLAESEHKNLWMSEVDGSVTAGTDAGEMASALGFANLMKTDLNGMQPSAWIMWDAVDIHVDSQNKYDYASEDAMYNDIGMDKGNGFWGIAIADHDTSDLLLTKKYYAYGQFSRYIEPGDTLIASGDNTVCAYDKKDNKAVIVAVNTAGTDKTWKYNLADFTKIGSKVTAIRTSGTLKDGENWADVSDSDNIMVDQSAKTVTATAKANSITTYVIDGVTYDSSKETVVSTDADTIYAVKGTTAVLPSKIQVKTSKNNTKSVPVTWDTKGVDLTKEGTVSGNADGYDFTADIRFVEPNLQYFIDCNNVKSTSYKAADSYADLLNGSADQKYTSGSWGYLGDYGAYDGSKPEDAWDAGWYAKSGQNLEYKLPMESGDYKVTFGFKEWWQNGTDYRKMAMYQTQSGAGEIKLGTTGSMDGWKNWKTVTYDTTVTNSGDVTYSVRKANNNDPVLSFLKVQHVLDLTELKKEMAKAQSMDTTGMSASAKSRLQNMTMAAMTLMLQAKTTQKQINTQTEDLKDFLQTGGKAFSEEEIAENDYILYLTDCGSKDTSVVPDDEKMGLYQSVTDQEYGEDKGTGLTWGYAADDDYNVRVNGGSSDGTLTGTYVYMSDKGWTYKKGESGFKYSYELPERDNDVYEVTVGVKSPWSNRTADIVMEGQTVDSKITLAQNTLVEKTHKVTVTDGTLNIFVTNPTRENQYQDPLLSYIIVKAVPAYTIETLKTALAKYAQEMSGHEYTGKTQAAYDKAAEAAQKLIDEKSENAKQIKTAYDNLVSAFEALFEVHKTNYTSITGVNGAVMYDNNGVKIQAHGGQVQQLTVDGVTKYYWYGEDKTHGMDPVDGVHLYTSTDLYNWTDEGMVLQTIPVSEKDFGKDQEAGYKADLSVFETDDYFKKLYGDFAGQAADDSRYSSKLEEVYWNLADDRCVMERPKVLYNEKTGKYVMWFHCDGRTPGSSATYGKARAGVAIADSPTGPFKFLGAYKLNYSESANHSWDNANLGSVRDMNVFEDTDGSAYVIYSSDGNTNMYIAKLNSSYTNVAKDQKEAVLGEDFTLNFEGASREAPAMFRYKDKYYLITSACTGWSANAARYAVADDPMGPWTMVANPCTDDGASTTYQTQSTCVFPVDAAAGKFIYMGDRWNSSNLGDSRYVWLPVKFESGSKIALKSYSDWTLDLLDTMGAFEVKTELPGIAESADDLEKELPSEVSVELSDGSVKTMAVTWSGLDQVGILGTYDITGTLANGATFTRTINMKPRRLLYAFDCAGSGDQAYTAANGAGYTGTVQSGSASSYDMGTKSAGTDMWSHGYWAAGGRSITYAFDLKAGDYTLATGYQEWWNTARPTRITVTDADGNTLATTDFTLAATDTARLVTTAFKLDADSKVTVSVTKTGNPDPVLSFIGLVYDSMVIRPDQPVTPVNPAAPGNGTGSGTSGGTGTGVSGENGAATSEAADTTTPSGKNAAVTAKKNVTAQNAGTPQVAGVTRISDAKTPLSANAGTGKQGRFRAAASATSAVSTAGEGKSETAAQTAGTESSTAVTGTGNTGKAAAAGTEKSGTTTVQDKDTAKSATTEQTQKKASKAWIIILFAVAAATGAGFAERKRLLALLGRKRK